MKEDYFLPCFRVRFETRKKILVDGLWFGPPKAKRVVIFMHGLTGSAFSMSRLVNEVADKDTAVLTFNNRGFEKISKMRFAGKQKWLLAGAALEKFTDCIDDIESAIRFVKKKGARDIFLAGQSTGCQKSIYWASKKGKDVRGIILLSPMSDYATACTQLDSKKYSRALTMAKSLIKKGKGATLLPQNVWPWIDSAQRFESLYTPDSEEEIFSYIQLEKVPTKLKRVRIPILAVLGEKDEHAGLPIGDIEKWFAKYIFNGEVVVVEDAGHSLSGAEKEVAGYIRRFMKESLT